MVLRTVEQSGEDCGAEWVENASYYPQMLVYRFISDLGKALLALPVCQK